MQITEFHLFPFQFYYFLALVDITAQYYKNHCLIYINFIAKSSVDNSEQIKIAPSLLTGCFSYTHANYV